MQSPRILTRQTLRRAMLIVALLIGSSTAVAGMSSASLPPLGNSDTGSATAHVMTRILPGDRAIMLLEGRDPANAGLTFVIARGAGTEALFAEVDSETRLNICVPCDNLA